MTKMISISIDPDDLYLLDQYVKSNNLNRSKFIVSTIISKIKKSQTKGNKKWTYYLLFLESCLFLF